MTQRGQRPREPGLDPESGNVMSLSPSAAGSRAAAGPSDRALEEGPPGRQIVARALAAGGAALDEFEAKALLAAYDIPVVPGTMVTALDEAVAAAVQLGYPLVMKGSSKEVLHKTEAGLVLLDIRDEEEIAAGFKLLRHRGGEGLQGILVECMIQGDRELVVGMTRDPQFGPVVMFGLGGVLTEAVRDVVFGVVPLDRREAEELLDKIKGKALLGPFRGLPPVDRGVLVHIILAVAQMALDHPWIREIDLNPLLVDGSRPVAVDALITLGPPPPEREPRPPVDLSRLDAVFAPRSVAVVGASNDPTKWGGTIMENIISGGYEGRIYPVNPRVQEIFGRPAYCGVADLSETPDLVLIAVPAHLVAGIVDECGEKGVPAVVVISGGFSETGPEGAVLEAELRAIAAHHGIAMIGPNCMGVMSSWSRFYGTGAFIIHPRNGPASFLSQSGNMGIQLMAAAEERKGGVGKFVGLGNEALLDSTDLFEYFRRDPQTGLILAYVEGFDDGQRFLQTARKATADKPVIVLRSGMSEYGRKAAASHTGAMAGSAEVFEAVVRQSGLIATIDPDEFVDLAFCLSYLPLPRGERVAIVTMGGGWGVLSADEVSRSGLVMADLPPEVMAEIDQVLPPYWSHGNPVDLVGTTAGRAPEKVLQAVVRSDAVDAVIVLGVVGVISAPGKTVTVARSLERKEGFSLGKVELPLDDEYRTREDAFIRRVSELMNVQKKPIINVSFTPLDQAVFEHGGPYATVVLTSPLRAVRVLAKMASYERYLAAVRAGGFED